MTDKWAQRLIATALLIASLALFSASSMYVWQSLKAPTPSAMLRR